MKRYVRSTAATLLLTALGALSAQAGDSAPGYEELVARLAGSHPGYRAMQSEVAAADAAVRVASAFPDPMLEMELMDLDSDERMVERSTRYTWEQLFPLWGKRGLRQAGAEADRRAAEARAELTLAELRAMLRVAYAELFAAYRASAINDEVARLLADMALSAGTRYANGLAAQQDVIKVKAEQTALAAEKLMLRGEMRRASAQINTLVGAPAEELLPAPGALPDTGGFATAWQSLQATLDATPALAAADATVQARRAARDLAAREQYPDLTVGVSPVEMDGRLDSWQLMLRVELPLYGGRSAMEAESVARLAGAEQRREAELRAVHGAAAEAWASYQAAREQQQVFETQLLGEAELNLRAALAGYQSGKVDFDTVIEAERQVREARLRALAAAVTQQRALARFEQVTGVQL
jgi:outer membrane protein TolC